MKPETEMTMRQLLSLDPLVDPSRLNRAIRILKGLPPDLTGLLHVVRHKEARATLGVCRATYTNLIQHGDLVPVRGSGTQSIGITRDSLIAYINQGKNHR